MDVKPLFAIAFLALGACQVTPRPISGSASATTASAALVKDSPQWRGHKFAVNRCADCHSVDYAETSPLAAAPSFSAIANTPDLSETTLSEWMKNHRNYPDEMYFEIPAENIDDLVAYILTLRRTN
jgi:hypothetical protein